MVKTQVAYKPHPKNMRLDLETIVKKLYRVFFRLRYRLRYPYYQQRPKYDQQKATYVAYNHIHSVLESHAASFISSLA